MSQQVIGATVNGIGRNDVIAGTGHVLQRIGDGSRSRCQCQSGNTAFECSDAGLEHSLCGIG
ncbi:hypothetical protein SDC9_150397 [bioreactor metagenome]|uniref:Uncharacterized protein n=1 Tax=bioreactor metagenome TaxID=1076179 RepID=A0A645EPH4_9ZZZZ